MTTTEQDRDQQRAEVAGRQISAVAVGVVIAVAAWALLIWIVTNRLPTIEFRWLAFGLLHIAITGTVLPVVRFLNMRFAREDGRRIGPMVLVRQSMWFGVLGVAAAWLAIPRLFSIPLLLILAIALFIIEVLLRIRENTAYEPPA